MGEKWRNDSGDYGIEAE